MSIKEIDGMRGLQKKLMALGPAVGGKFLRQATMRAMQVAEIDAKLNIPVSDRDYAATSYKGRPLMPGFAQRSIKRRSKISRDKSMVWVWLGVEKEAFYAVNFVELGTSGFTTKSGKQVKGQRRQPWLEPALRHNRNEIVHTQGELLKRKIEQEARKKRR